MGIFLHLFFDMLGASWQTGYAGARNFFNGGSWVFGSL